MTQAPHRYVPIYSNSEHVDDIPLLLGYLQRLQIPQIIDQAFVSTFATPSKNLGTLLALWLSHMLSQSPRQTRHLRSWISSHPETLRRYAPTFTQLSNASDSHLREILSILANDRYWEKVETALNRHVVQQYSLSGSYIRLEKNSSLWYVNSDGTLQIDHERRWRSGASAVHMVMGILEPSNIPLAISFTLGNEQTRDLALEVVERTRACMSQPLVYVGNGALSSTARAAIVRNQDQYLGLLSQAEVRQNLATLLRCPPNIHLIFPTEDQPATPIAEAYERSMQLQSIDPLVSCYEERQLYIRRQDRVVQQTALLQERVQRACQEIMILTQPKRGKRRLLTLEALHQAAHDICVEYDVENLIDIRCSENVDARTIRRYRGRPTTTRVNHMLDIVASPNETALKERMQELGWHGYVTTLGAQALSVRDLLDTSMKASALVERLHNRQLSLLPGVIQRLEHTRGLIRLMTITLRCLALMDYIGGVRFSSTTTQTSDSHTSIWRSEDVLNAFLNVTLTTVYDGRQEHHHLTALSTGQRRMLDLLGLPHSLYQLT